MTGSVLYSVMTSIRVLLVRRYRVGVHKQACRRVRYGQEGITQPGTWHKEQHNRSSLESHRPSAYLATVDQDDGVLGASTELVTVEGQPRSNLGAAESSIVRSLSRWPLPCEGPRSQEHDGPTGHGERLRQRRSYHRRDAPPRLSRCPRRAGDVRVAGRRGTCYALKSPAAGATATTE